MIKVATSWSKIIPSLKGIKDNAPASQTCTGRTYGEKGASVWYRDVASSCRRPDKEGNEPRVLFSEKQKKDFEERKHLLKIKSKYLEKRVPLSAARG